MAIQINLLAEAQAAEELRRKDPVKRGIWIGSFLVFLVVIWIVDLQLDILYANKNLKDLKAKWSSMEGRWIAAMDNRSKLGQLESKLSGLEYLSTNRFLWGSMLNCFQMTTVENVQLTRIRGEQSYMLTQAVEGKTNGTQIIARIPATSIERITLTVEGKDWNASEQVYNKYKETLSNSEYFLQHLKRRDGFILQQVSSSVFDPNDSGRQFVAFTLESHFPEARRSE